VRVIILGCGRVGSTLALALTQEGHDVTVVDRDPSAFAKAVQRLGPEFTRETIRGVGIDTDVLQQAGIEKADAFISVTSGDNTNIVAAQIAKFRYHVPKVFARVYDPIRAEVYREAGIETICTTLVGVGIFHDLMMDRPLGNCQRYLESLPEVEERPHEDTGQA
jgi:trk system potassium uptake protein TrkA